MRIRTLVSTFPRLNEGTPVWPWLLLVLMTLPAFWHVLVFPNDLDNEFPGVERPTFNRYPPPAYRLAEAGDTIDRVQIYVASLAIVLSVIGLVRSDRRGPWLAALALSFAGFWQGANPGPTFDGWHGLGWRTILNPNASWTLRVELLALGLALAGLISVGLGGLRRLQAAWTSARANRTASIWIVSAFLYALGLTGLTDFEPFGYWPRWELVWGLAGYCSALLLALPPVVWRARSILRLATLGSLLWLGFVWSGIELTWYHRPLNRLREIVPGKIMISAIPTVRGLEIAQERHHFKTIINLFPEDGRLRSPLWPAELAFIKKHGLNYLNSTSDTSTADDFLDLTLKTAQDPNAWPILIHCHGCMDRTPAWVGIYQFVVEGKPLIESLRFIEQHRGYRPKASVTLLYQRVLSRLAPERYKSDPVSSKFDAYVHGLRLDPRSRAEPLVGDNANLKDDAGVHSESVSAALSPLPSLTPRR